MAQTLIALRLVFPIITNNPFGLVFEISSKIDFNASRLSHKTGRPSFLLVSRPTNTTNVQKTAAGQSG